MKTRWVLSVGLAAMGLCCLAAGAVEVRLASCGKAEAVIVVGRNADKAARFAAADLKWHLDSITGGDFRIVTDDEATKDSGKVLVCVGPSALVKTTRDDFGAQEFSVRATPGRIELVGRDKKDKGGFVLKMEAEGVVLKNAPDFFDEQGTMYAVYDFLERECGVVWADTSDLGTVLPHKPDFSVCVKDRKKKPFIEYRGGTITGHRLKSDLWKKNSEGGRKFRSVAYRHPERYDAQDRLFRLRHRIGGVNRKANHSFYHYYDKYWREDSKSFIRKWPEIFAKGYVGLPPQMCYSSREFIELVIKDVRSYFDQDPTTGKFTWGCDNYCLEPMDNSFYCKCEKCESQLEPGRIEENGVDSTYWFRFVKTIADEIKKSHPAKRISTLAYHSHEALPRGVTLPDNVIVYFCIYANRMPYSSMLDAQLARMKQWRDAYPGQPLAMWLYNTFPLEYSDKSGFNCLPGFFADEAYKQFQFFKENDVRAGIFHCGFNGEVDNYMHLKWMIDPDRKPDELLDEYFRGYGKAAAPLKEYYRTVEARYCDKSRYPKGVMHQTAALAWGGKGAAEFMEKLGALMAEAEAAAETPDEKRRVETWKLEYWDYMREGYETYIERQKAPKPEWVARRVNSAEGDVQKVDWSASETYPFRLFNAGTMDETKISGVSRIVHDGQWLYVELDLAIDVTNNVISPGIFIWDTWELFFARQEAPPYRHYASSPDGRISAASNGEVNWRMNVPATESGPNAYGAKVVSDRTDPHLWRQRVALPLDAMLDKPVNPGDTIFLNCVTVLNPKISKGRADNFILAVTPATTVHTTDRMGRVILEKDMRKKTQACKPPLKVLMIGNSFSICNLREMPQIAKSMGKRLDLASLYIGGCSLERHWKNVAAAETNATLRPYRFDRTIEGKKVVENGSANIPDALVMAKWDVVTIQQCSHFSWRPETYHPFGDSLVAKIRALAPQAKIVVQETWSYPPWDKRLKQFGFGQKEMYSRLHAAYAAFAKQYGLEVIPVGTAAEIVPERNRLFTAPDFHFNGEGEYLQGLVFAAHLFGVDVAKCPYKPANMDAARAGELKSAAMSAISMSGTSAK